jgi:chorismate mutase
MTPADDQPLIVGLTPPYTKNVTPVKEGDNPLQGRKVGGKVYLQSKEVPSAVVCIACGRNVPVGEIDMHHQAHTANRDGELPPTDAVLETTIQDLRQQIERYEERVPEIVAERDDLLVQAAAPVAWHAAYATGSFEETFARIFREAFDLLVARQKKYGPDNIFKLGTMGVYGRMSDDKMERVKRSLNGRIVHGEVILDEPTDFSDESYEDALLDIANYALIMLALHRRLWGFPLQEELDG